MKRDIFDGYVSSGAKLDEMIEIMGDNRWRGRPRRRRHHHHRPGWAGTPPVTATPPGAPPPAAPPPGSPPPGAPPVAAPPIPAYPYQQYQDPNQLMTYAQWQQLNAQQQYPYGYVDPSTSTPAPSGPVPQPTIDVFVGHALKSGVPIKAVQRTLAGSGYRPKQIAAIVGRVLKRR